jgi:heme/copper-type cytochrome/quinol oxidase subunit 2
MINKPPMPSFPQGCTYTLLIIFIIFVLALIVNQFTKTKDPIDPNKEKSNTMVTYTIIITLFVFIIVSASCGWYFNLKKKQWIYNYGTDFQKSVQLATDILSVVN